MAEAASAANSQASAPHLYPLDQNIFEIEVNARRGERAIKTVHRLRRATLAELIDRDKQSAYQSEDLNSSESRTVFDIEGPNAKLYDRLILAVNGYKLAGHNEEWLEIARDEKGNPQSAWLASIPAGHKATAIAGMYIAKYSIDDDSDDGFALDGGDWTIRQAIGAEDDPLYTITHRLRSPTEKERREYNRSAADVISVRGARRQKQKIVTNLKPFVALYDQLIERLAGVSLDGQPYSEAQKRRFVDAVDPIFKQKAISTLMSVFEGSLSD